MYTMKLPGDPGVSLWKAGLRVQRDRRPADIVREHVERISGAYQRAASLCRDRKVRRLGVEAKRFLSSIILGCGLIAAGDCINARAARRHFSPVLQADLCPHDQAKFD